MAEAPAHDERVINVGTRKSPLALAQTQIVVEALEALFPTHRFPIHSMTTTGDRDQTTALYNFGGKGLWTSQLEDQLVAGHLDLVVHSLKDMPTTLPAGCVLGCVTKRDDPRDTLVIKKALADKHGWTRLDDLPAGSVIGTSSVRRIAQLARRHPRLRFKDVRGNIQTRLRKLDDDPDMAAIVLAAAGLQRMDLGHHISQYLDMDNGGILHAVGQGALGVECRDGDERVLRALARLQDPDAALACAAERSLMRTLEGGCSVPIGVETRWVDGKLRLRATVVSTAGTEAVDADVTESITTSEDAEELGKRVALDLVRRGADKILDSINATRPAPETTE
ncbi:porphobilinogen deaminase, dipyromethane cofactor binding domain-containing protein [Hirsutella rhossiliensis]|uniref:Porphobilinogen deaminase n=1 Tax=Hirsutella rhossiliensis TaxID=111463 RepID=A0A9P8SEB4_9HYPO|nr:porphobilinogen deaminase, dipyromethane cofactor binding domain-containing protein [Hirsutella rhossiliensis]KAH0958220.1 porphobilinogen deaminase, dipyromethane cofactor binding domain-containing protein [Hirsutella rhossiliensis]